MVAPQRLERLTFLTDIITPYMLTVFGALSEIVRLTVVFCSETGTRAMPWQLTRDFHFPHEVVGGLTIRRDNADNTDYYLSPRIFSAIARSRPDAIVSAGYSVPTVYAAAYKAAAGARLLIHSDGTSQSERQLSAIQRAARAVLLRAADGCVANSGPAAERFLELGVRRDRLFEAPHSTDLQPMWRIAAERDYETNGRVNLLTVGRLIPRKGVDRLLAALAEARRELPGLALTVVGDGPEEDELKRQSCALGLGEAVDFRGFVSHDQLAPYYASADIFAFPTLEDPFGFVLLEAAAAGLPVVASPHGGATPDLVRDGETGLVADPLDEHQFAAAIARVGGNSELRSRLGRAAHVVTRERTPEASARGYVEAAEAVIRAPGRALAR